MKAIGEKRPPFATSKSAKGRPPRVSDNLRRCHLRKHLVYFQFMVIWVCSRMLREELPTMIW
jgi:hypothetical protein